MPVSFFVQLLEACCHIRAHFSLLRFLPGVMPHRSLASLHLTCFSIKLQTNKNII